ncbi:hypothetical protein C7375_10870 [Frischella perrara]|uniref:UPF0125 protein FPB0191_00643 n=1 Tax=Frischella perrara TaxID=1267021 RepID=A0A0A7RYV9_FRIPE|nr:RnfH family protein [Frischella perrara]AJA44474.1 hypothetical protein FPB0191_00643 [Frischella perrara]PWV60978.1 hypothetical protein C7375_10870 [Frischella perrara]
MMINIQIVYALPENPTIVDVQINEGSTALEAIKKSNIVTTCNLVLDQHKIGIFGNLVNLDYLPKDGDRIEIYRSLINDPKEIRRRRANASKNTMN